MQLRIAALPADPLAAAAAFHAQWLAKIETVLASPPRDGEVAAQSADGGDCPSPLSHDPESPLHQPAAGPPPRAGEDPDLALIFPPADHTHRGWRLAAVQSLARTHAPLRINAVASDNEAAITAALRYLAAAPGVTGQYLPLDGTGASQLLC